MGVKINVISFIIGATISAVATYYITRDMERSRADEEIASMKEYYSKKEEKLLGKVEAAEARVEAAIKAKNSYEESCINLGVTLSEYKKKEETPAKEETEEDEDEDPAIMDDVPIEGIDYYVHDTRKSEPYQITESQFSEEMREFFDKITLEWYPKDDILLTETKEFVDNRDKIIGDLSEFVEDVKPDDELYFRNELLGADYMVLVKPGYGEDNMKGEIL